jgi:transmembrane sensor
MTAPATPPDWDATARYLSGESPAEESTVVREWLEANPMDRDLVERLYDATAAAPANVDVEAALARVHARMQSDAPAVRSIESARRTSTWRYAALAALPVAAVIGAVIIYRGRPADQTSAAASRTVATGVGQRDSVLLADGSRVILGPQSRIVIPADYATRRTVDLTGDGYFDVKHDAAHPFSVRTSKALVEDIGTAFTVESDAGVMTSVAVVSGSVRLRAESSAATDGVVLSAGDRGSIDTRGTTRAERRVVRDEDVAWTRGSPAFRDAPLEVVAAEVQRWYGVTVIIPDSAMRQRRVTASFNGEPVDRVLQILGLLLGASVEHHGDSARIAVSR